MDRSTFQALHATGRLPSPKGVALHLMRLIQREHVTTGEIAEIIMSDPALAGRVIASANSASHYGHRPVVSVAQAIAVNGMAATSRLALGLSIIASHQTGHCRGFDYPRFWIGSVVAALAMQNCAVQARIGAPAEMFTLGLLHRIGVLALATLHPDDYGGLVAGAQDGTELARQEQQRYATDHRELGLYLLEEWGIPEPFREAAVAADADPALDWTPSSRVGKLTDLLRVARAMASAAVSGDLAALEAPATHRAAAQNGLGPDDVFAVWDLVADAWPCWAKILAVETTALPRRGAPGPELAAADLPPADPPEAPSTQLLRVMAIGARGALRSQLAESLDKPGIELHFADTADDALKLAVGELPQLIVIDWSDRDSGGTQICQTLRESGIGRTAYILVLSPRQGEQELLAALKAGADEFLALPVSREVLDAHLRVARRLVALKEEVQRDREEIRHYAAELAVANRRLQELAGSDPLTGLPNRRFAMDHVAREWQSAQSSGEPLSCLMIDVDNFKRINDTHGHDAGDRVLAAIAQVLRTNARAQDTVCRVGGEEFLVICRATDSATARFAGERLRAVVQSTAFDIDGVQYPVSISVGVSVATKGVADASVLLKLADQALYRAKQHGRNRVEAL
ncbi:MAG: diguanylate cyclase [Betaproteobacteria bacterium]|nr:diguanylate cyclase [Betaproteobacteria bacterium]